MTSEQTTSGETIRITVNGEQKAIAVMSVYDYLKYVDLDTRPLAVELNRVILLKSEYRTTLLREGDQMEIVWFVGGG